MPKRRTDDVVHVMMTDHWIQRRKPAGDLMAAKPEIVESAAALYRGEVTPYYPAPLADTPDDALYVAAAQVRNRLAWVLLVVFVPVWYLLLGSMTPHRGVTFRLQNSPAPTASWSFPDSRKEPLLLE